MISKTELESAIRSYEDAQNSYSNCEKLATFYILYDHMYGARPIGEVAVEYTGKSDFANIVHGKDPESVWAVMDELMDALSVLNPNLYRGTIEKIQEME